MDFGQLSVYGLIALALSLLLITKSTNRAIHVLGWIVFFISIALIGGIVLVVLLVVVGIGAALSGGLGG